MSALAPRRPGLLAELHAGERCPHDADLATGLSVVVCTYRRAGSLARFLDSLDQQELQPDALLVVDASPDEETQELMARRFSVPGKIPCRTYVRVGAEGRGLTLQRNRALAMVRHDLVAFFDDDVVLLPGCLAELSRALRTLGDDVVGVGAAVQNERREPDALWRLRRALRLVPHLQPGRYTRSGLSIPWNFLPQAAGWVDGEWLPGCGMAWRTRPARATRFFEGFAGYAQGEDLDFSLRMRRLGRLVFVPQARLLHLHERAGRPDDYRLGYMAIRNRWEIHRRGLPDRRASDVVRFLWVWSVDTLLLARHLVTRHALRAIRQIAGRVAAAWGLLVGRRRAA